MGYVPGNETNDIPFGIPLALKKYTELSGIQKFGYNPSVGTTFQTVWEGASPYPYITSAGPATVTSTNAADNTGVVTVSGLDANYNEATEEIAIGGSAGTVNWIRVHRAKMTTAATGDVNLGTISVAVGGVTRASISPEIGQTLMTLFTVPDGHRGFLLSWYASPSKQKELTAKVMVRRHNDSGVWNTLAFATSFGSTIQRKFQVLEVLEPRTDMEVRAKVDATSGVSAGFELILEKI